MTRSRLTPWLWLGSALFIVYGTTIPFQFTADPELVRLNLARVSLNPLISPATGLRLSIPDSVQNILLFVPFGVFGVAALGGGWSIARRVVLVTIAGASLSAAVECVQLFTVDRISSVSDLMTNTMGAYVGGCAWVAVRGVFRGVIGELRRWGLVESPLFYPLMVATLVVCAAAWEPFDPTLDVGSLWPKAKALLSDPWQAAALTDEGLQLVRFSVLATLASIWARGQKANAWLAVACVAVAGVVLEGSQIFIATRMPSVEDATVNVAGALIGGLVAPIVQRTRAPRLWVAILAMETWIGTAVLMLTPFTISATRRPFEWILFLGSYMNTTTEALSHTIELMLIYFPIGFAIRWTSKRSGRAYALAAVAAALLELPIEYLQGWIVGRYPDLTDIVLAVMGAIAGVWVAGTGYGRFQTLVGHRPMLHAKTMSPSVESLSSVGVRVKLNE